MSGALQYAGHEFIHRAAMKLGTVLLLLVVVGPAEAKGLSRGGRTLRAGALGHDRATGRHEALALAEQVGSGAGGESELSVAGQSVPPIKPRPKPPAPKPAGGIEASEAAAAAAAAGGPPIGLILGCGGVMGQQIGLAFQAAGWELLCLNRASPPAWTAHAAAAVRQFEGDRFAPWSGPEAPAGLVELTSAVESAGARLVVVVDNSARV